VQIWAGGVSGRGHEQHETYGFQLHKAPRGRVVS
jgi:hypothetical protein